MKKDSILDLFSSLILGIGVVFFISPFLLYWWIHGDYERYLWIIKGPYPYSNFGSGPFQIFFLYTPLSLIGVVLTIVALLVRRSINKRRN